jgi:hypothetical protein
MLRLTFIRLCCGYGDLEKELQLLSTRLNDTLLASDLINVEKHLEEARYIWNANVSWPALINEVEILQQEGRNLFSAKANIRASIKARDKYILSQVRALKSLATPTTDEQDRLVFWEGLVNFLSEQASVTHMRRLQHSREAFGMYNGDSSCCIATGVDALMKLHPANFLGDDAVSSVLSELIRASSNASDPFRYSWHFELMPKFRALIGEEFEYMERGLTQMGHPRIFLKAAVEKMPVLKISATAVVKYGWMDEEVTQFMHRLVVTNTNKGIKALMAENQFEFITLPEVIIFDIEISFDVGDQLAVHNQHHVFCDWEYKWLNQELFACVTEEYFQGADQVSQRYLVKSGLARGDTIARLHHYAFVGRHPYPSILIFEKDETTQLRPCSDISDKLFMAILNSEPPSEAAAQSPEVVVDAANPDSDPAETGAAQSPEVVVDAANPDSDPTETSAAQSPEVVVDAANPDSDPAETGAAQSPEVVGGAAVLDGGRVAFAALLLVLSTLII